MRLGVIIPTWRGHLPFLKRALDSLENQTRKPDLVAISISNVQFQDIDLGTYSFPIRLSITEKRQVTGTNRNCAIRLLSEDVDLIVAQDGDDESYPDRLAFLERAFQETNCDFLASSFVRLESAISSKEPILKEYHAYPNSLIADPGSGLGLIASQSAEGTDIHHGHLAFTPAVWKNHKYSEAEQDFTKEDSLYARQLAQTGYKGTYVSTQLVRYHLYTK
jgi:hypothetical protein